MTYWLAWEEPRAVGDLVHVEKFFARNLGGLIHARTRVPGRLGKATSRTPSMYVGEKSDEAIVLAKRLNKGRPLPAEVVVGLWPSRAGPAYGTVTAAGLRQLGGFIYRLAFIEGLPDDGHFGFACRAIPGGQSAPTQDAARSTCRP